MKGISVIIPTWNRATMIAKAVNSVLGQTVPVFEVLVCDDGSTDHTEEVVTAISEKDKRVQFIKCGRNRHPAVPRNIGIGRSAGEWVAFLDSDDVWLPDKLEKQFVLMEKMGIKASSTNALRVIPEKGVNGNLLVYDKSAISYMDLLKCNHIICSSVVLHRSLLQKAVGFPEHPNCKGIEDYALWLRVATQCKFAYLDEPLVLYNDDAVHSVRGEVTNNAYRQRVYLFRDFLGWGKGVVESNELFKARVAYIDAFKQAALCTMKSRIKKVIRGKKI